MNYTQSLDLIFQSYLAAKPMIVGKLDRVVRNPEILLDVARKLDILPDPRCVIKVTGSKGKGTVARLCAQGLSHYDKTGVVLSPEEISHLDRMRINGLSITEERFIQCFQTVWAAIDLPKPPAYLSPYGLFLLIALQWFKEEGVSYVVIETGRGVKYDEGGQMAARLGIVTSIFFEHPSYLGPTLDDIRADKLSISESCEDVIVADDHMPAGDQVPGWYQKSQQLARQALAQFLDHDVDLPDGPCASFGHREIDGRLFYYEGMIAPESADKAFLQKLIKRHKGSVCFYISLPDDKDFSGVCDLLESLGCDNRHIIMTGERGVLSYDQARKKTLAYEGPYDDVGAIRQGLMFGDHEVCYFIGTQTFLRLIKQAYFQ